MGQHMKYAASTSSRWLVCTGYPDFLEMLRTSGQVGEDKSSEPADRGTAVHHICEEVIEGKRKLEYFLGKTIFLKSHMQHRITITQKEIDGAKMFIDHIKAKTSGKRARVYSEQKYDLTKVYGSPTGGTADATILYRRDGQLDIDDYKNGRIPVEIEGNTQLRIYALGAYYKFRDKLDIKKVKLTIVQPNSFHVDGPIRDETISIRTLLRWERRVLAAVLGAIQRGRGQLVPNEDEQCYWCECKSKCPARKKSKPKLVKDCVTDLIPTTEIGTLPDPEDLDENELDDVLQNADRVIKFYTACRKEAEKRLDDDPSSVSGWQLAPRLGNTRFISNKRLLRRQLKKFGLRVDQDLEFTETRTRTPTEFKKHLELNCGFEKEQIDKIMSVISDRPKSGVCLVQSNTAQQDFKDI